MRKIRKTFLYLLMIAILTIQVYPIFWIFMTSLKTTEEVQKGSTFALPAAFNIHNYIRAVETSNLGLYFKNSIIVLLVTITALVLFSSTAAFALEKMRFRMNQWVLSFFLLGITIPIHVTLIPLFQIYRNSHLLNTYWALIVPQIGFNLPLSIYLFITFYKFVPDTIMEAAAIDGAVSYTHLLDNKNMFADLRRLGAAKAYTERVLRIQLKKIYLFPTAAGCIIGILFAALLTFFNDMRIDVFELNMLGVVGILIVVISAVMYIMYRVSLKKAEAIAEI